MDLEDPRLHSFQIRSPETRGKRAYTTLDVLRQ